MNHTPGPWTWRFMQGGGFSLCTPDRGMLIVMDFARRGMNGAQPRFSVWPGDRDRNNVGRMTKADELGELHDHPDARLISFAPEVFEALKKHVCVKAISGDGMNKVDYYPVEESDCELCKVVALVENKAKAL